MPGTISMETERALGVAIQLEQNARILEQSYVELTNRIRQLEVSWQGGGAREAFFVEFFDLKRRLDLLTRELHELQSRLVREIKEWEIAASRLGQGSGGFFSTVPAGSTGAGAAGIAGGVGAAIGAMGATAGGGEVLGVSTPTAGVDAQTYQQMRWSDKFTEEAAINAKMGELEQQLFNLPADRAAALEQIDKDIAYWTEMKAKYEEESKKFINKIPVNLRGDSASDIYKDLVKDADTMLAKLHERKELLQSDTYWVQREAGINTQITNLKRQQAVLNEVINAGIPPSGPTKGITLAGCAKFVAEKRDISGFSVPGDMNAGRWDDHAIAAGYDVGSRPVKGSIMVIDHNNSAFKGIDEVGHVVYVENVTRVEGGYKVTYSEASTPRDSNGNWTGSWTYVNARTTTKIIPDNATGINYIYEK